MSDLILPGPQAPQGGLTIYVPRGVEDAPTGGCDICGTPFYGDADARAHLATYEHREEVERVMEARRGKRERLSVIFDPLDPEIDEHMRRVGRNMLREGRLTMRKNETAGPT